MAAPMQRGLAIRATPKHGMSGRWRWMPRWSTRLKLCWRSAQAHRIEQSPLPTGEGLLFASDAALLIAVG